MIEALHSALKALDMTRDQIIASFASDYGKGRYHAEALFGHIYKNGNAEVAGIAAFAPAPALAARVEQDYRLNLPEIDRLQNDGDIKKYSLTLSDGMRTESVLIPMSGWNTLCISSQIGCLRACTFCETGRMGLARNLRTSEIIAQWAVARFKLNVEPRNIVFMGMGEPFDNFAHVIKAVRILSDPKGASLSKKRISISTSGHVEGIRSLTELENKNPDEAWRKVHLAVSLNAADDEIRNRLMPINRIWPLAELKQALMESPQSSVKDSLYFEYVVIPGVNDTEDDARKLADWMDGFNAKVNIIPYHPGADRRWDAPDSDTMDRFHAQIRSSGIGCRTRRSRGKGIEAACGMLGGKAGTS